MNHLCLWISWLILPPSIPLCSSRPNLRLLFGILSIFGYHGIYGNRLSLMPWWVKKATLLRNFSQSDCWLHLLRIYFTILVGISKIHQASNLPWCWSVPWWFMNINLCMWRDHVTGKMSWCFAFFFPRNLMLNRRYIFKWLGFRASHVSFRGGNSYGCYLQAGSVLLDWKGKSLMLRNPCDTKQTSRESIQNDSCVSVKLSWNFGLLFVWMTAFSSIRCGCGNTCLDPLLLFKISHTLPIQLQTSFNIAKKEWDAESIW